MIKKFGKVVPTEWYGLRRRIWPYASRKNLGTKSLAIKLYDKTNKRKTQMLERKSPEKPRRRTVWAHLEHSNA
jgi:hypothetical protein